MAETAEPPKNLRGLRRVQSQAGSKAAQAAALAPAVLTGHVPAVEADDGWTYRTDAPTARSIRLTPGGAPLTPDMLLWPLRKSSKTGSQNVLLVGRSGSNDVIIPFNRVSKLHARITVQGERYVIQDAGSTNGTRVNGRQLPPGVDVPLKDADQVSFAEAHLFFFHTAQLLEVMSTW